MQGKKLNCYYYFYVYKKEKFRKLITKKSYHAAALTVLAENLATDKVITISTLVITSAGLMYKLDPKRSLFE